MRFALVAVGDPSDPGTWSGTPRNLLLALRAAGAQVRTVSTFAETRARYRMAASALWRGRMAVHGRLDATGRPEIRYDYERSGFSRLIAARAVTRTLGSEPLDAVLHMSQLTLSGRLRAPAAQSVYIDTTWHLTAPSWLAAGRVDRRLARTLDEEERRAFASAAHVFTIAQYVRDDVVQHYGLPPERVTAVGTGLGNTVAYHGDKNYGNKHLLFAAKIRFVDKGGPLLLEAFARAHAVDPELRLTLVGQDDYRRYDDLPGVSAPGSVGLEELQALFADASLFVMPASYEPWGLVYLQALAARTPIVGLRKHAFPELAQDGAHGFVTEAATADALAATLLHAVSDPDKLARMGREGQAWVLNRFSWDNVASAVLQALA